MNVSAISLNWQAWFNVTPLFLGAGALCYGVMPAEPSLWSGLLPFMLCVCAWCMRDQVRVVKQLLGVGLFFLGMWLGAWQTFQQTTLFLDKEYRYAPIVARIADVVPADRKVTLLLENVTSPDIVRDEPLTLRLSYRGDGATLRRGDMISARATVFPPSRRALPTAFDFSRYFFFRDIEGVGYVTGKVTLVNAAPLNASWLDGLGDIRAMFGRTLLRMMSQPEAGIAVALATGKKDAITKQVRTALSQSSLGHMLAISGMHIGIVCGVVFVYLRLALSAIPMVALRYPIKQYAALSALIVGALYLCIADFPVSAIRAYAMAAIVFGAILLNREPDTLRSIVLAALLLLLIAPSYVLDIGFQLSFCATLGLVLSYRRLRCFNERLESYHKPLWWRAVYYMLQLACSSFIAGLVTAPLVAFHFNHATPYGVLANMLALPLLSFFVAPALLLALLSVPFGLHPFFLQLAEYGISGIVAVAQYVAALPHASVYVTPMNPLALIMILACMFGLLLFSSKRSIMLCISGVALAACSVALAINEPHIIVAEDSSAIAVRTDDASWVLLKGTPRNFHVKQWEQNLGVSFGSFKQSRPSGWVCDKAGCDGRAHNQEIRIRFDYKIKEPLCKPTTNIVISSFYSDRWACASHHAMRIDRTQLQHFGAHVVSFKDGKPTLWHSCMDSGAKPWSRCTYLSGQP